MNRLRLTKKDKKDILVALHYASRYHLSLVDAYSTCQKEDPSRIEVEKEAADAINDYAKIHDKIKKTL